jgi:hypothetical protein
MYFPAAQAVPRFFLADNFTLFLASRQRTSTGGAVIERLFQRIFAGPRSQIFALIFSRWRYKHPRQAAQKTGGLY